MPAKSDVSRFPPGIDVVNDDVSNPVGIEVKSNYGKQWVVMHHWWLPDGSPQFVRTKKSIAVSPSDLPALISKLVDVYNSMAPEDLHIKLTGDEFLT